jgi:protein dithiol:quinone oxidoreductase
MLKTARNFALCQSVLCCLALFIALALEVFFELEPCPLCVLQRIVLIAIFFVSVVMVFSEALPKGRFFLNTVTLFLIILGGFIAVRHIWLQSLPPEQVPACGPDLQYLLKMFSTYDILRLMLKGSGECAKITFRFLHLTLPMWTLLLYGIMGFLNMKIFVLMSRKNH